MFECIITHYSYSKVTGNPLIYSRVTGNPLIQSPDLSHTLSSKFELCKVDIILWYITYRSTAVSSLPLVRIVAISPGPNYCLYHLGACGTILGAEVPIMGAALTFLMHHYNTRTRFVASQHQCACWTATNFWPTWRSFGRRYYHSGGTERWHVMQLKIFLIDDCD